jgi:hypothetical protein
MQKYQTCSFGKLIRKIEIERETGSSVWINGRRNSKQSNHHSYFNTFDEAKQHLLKKAQRKIESARFLLQRARDHYGNVKGLKEL